MLSETSSPAHDTAPRLVSRIRSSLHSAAPSRANFGFERTLGILDCSGVALRFATHLAARSTSECQIQNSTRYFNLASGPLIPTFAKRLPKWGANVGIGPLVWFGSEIPLGGLQQRMKGIFEH